MGNRTAISKTDTVHAMNLSQRRNHLIHGYMRICSQLRRNGNNMMQTPIEIIAICADYIGILTIKSMTELKIERNMEIVLKNKEFEKRVMTASGKYNESICSLKVMVTGSGGVGKTALCMRFETDTFEEAYDPTIEDAYRKSYIVDDVCVVYDILDTAGQDEFISMQHQWFREAEIVLFVYSITDKCSFDAIPALIEQAIQYNEDEWGVSKFGIIAGNKCDLEYDRKIATKDGLDLAMKYGNLLFLETSAKEQINNDLVFHHCARLYMYSCLLDKNDHYASNKKEEKKARCVLL